MPLTRPKKVPTGNLVGSIANTIDSAAIPTLQAADIMPALSGTVKKVYYNKTDSETTASTTSYTNAVTVTVPMNTTLYDYHITYHTPITKDDGGTGEAVDLAIAIDGTTICQQGHRGHSVSGNAYLQATNDAWITSGYTGGTNRTVSGQIACYSPSTSVNNHDNHGQSGAAIVVYELYK